jgi:flagellar basal-body rod protein FlgC
MDNLSAIGKTAASAMRAQSERLRLVAENMANAESTGDTPGSDPYRRKVPVFESMVDESTGANTVVITDVIEDTSNFQLKHDPSHPAADAEGYVKMPNVNPLIELANMREASRSYEAALNVLDSGRKMKSQLIDMLG